MFFARIKTLTETLRFRLAVWNAGVVVLTAIATLVGLREGVRRALVHEVDQILIEDMREIELSIPARNYPMSITLLDDLNRKAEAHKLHGWYVRFIKNDDEQIFASVSAPPRTPPMPQLQNFFPITLGNFRVVQYQHQLSAGQNIIVRVGSSLDSIQGDMRRVDQNVAIMAGLVLIVAPLCGYWLAGRATRPLADIIRTTARLRPSKLDERLQIRGTGDELDQLSRTFNRLLDRIAIYLQQKRDFLANAAHELRSPLAAIRSTAEVGLNSHRGLAEYEDLLAGMIDECSSLEVLVNQLLFLAETEADALKSDGEPVLLDELVERSVGMFDGVAEFKGLTFKRSIQSAVTVEGNRHHLRQVLNNLIDNAIKFTSPQGQIAIELERDDTRQRAILRVRDSGMGISQEDIPHVFERFFRSDRSRHREGETRGTGLGLSICEAVVTSHGGQISVESELGVGSTFTVSLPLARGTPGAEAELAR